jgi:hypothetical protein
MRKIDDGLWVHEDSMKLLTLRMTVVQLSNGGLWVHSPTALSVELKRQVDDIGRVVAVVAPNNVHNLWLEEWLSAYPDATAFVARGIPKKLPALRGHSFIDEQARLQWSEDLDVEVMTGVPMFDECLFLHRSSRSLIVTDLVHNYRGRENQGFAKLITKLVLEPIGFKDICIAPPLRFPFVVKDRSAMAALVKAIRAWDFDRIIVTHGDIIEDDAQQTFSRLCAPFADG